MAGVQFGAAQTSADGALPYSLCRTRSHIRRITRVMLRGVMMTRTVSGGSPLRVGFLLRVACVVALICNLPVGLAANLSCDSGWQVGGMSPDFPQTRSAVCADQAGFAGKVSILPSRYSSPDWSPGAFENEIWVFDNAADGSPEIVIEFQTDGVRRKAMLYDRRSSIDGILQYADLDSYHAVVVVEAAGDWYVDDRNPNPNIDIYVDSDMLVIFGGSSKLSALGLTSTDGTLDYVISVRDTTGSGRPDREYRRAILPEGVEEAMGRTLPGIEQTAIMVNPGDDLPPISPWFGWPYFGSLSYGLLTNTPTPESLPPIQINWDTGEIEAIGEFVRSRGWDGQWFVYSFDRLQAGQAIAADFENPFAFYNLAGSQSRLADLAIRVTYSPPNHRFLRAGRYPEPLTGVRYTWVQSDGTVWQRMKFSLLGHRAPTTEVTFDEYSLTTFDYDTLPGLVTASSWDAVNFVVEMGTSSLPRGAGEGIYVWDDVGGGDYFFGLSEDREDALAARRVIEPGYRGEYALRPTDQLTLYYSQIDGQLHLYGAEGGIWNVGDGTELVYEDGNEDGYFDTWIVTREGQEVERLVHAGRHLLYATESTVAVLETELLSSAFELPPPASPEAWADLRALLVRHGASFDSAAAELRTIFDAHDTGRSLRATGSLRDIAWRQGSGLTIRADLSGIDQEGWTDSALVVGDNVYTLTDEDVWVREAAEVPTLSASFGATTEPRLGVAVEGALRLVNTSNTTWRGSVNLAIGSTPIASWPMLVVPGRGELVEYVGWTPAEPGLREAVLETPDGAVSVGALHVEAVARDHGWSTPIRVPVARPHWFLLVVAAVMITSSLVLAVRSWLR